MPSLEIELTNRAGFMFDWTREKDEAVKAKKIKKCVENMKICLEKRQLVRIKNVILHVIPAHVTTSCVTRPVANPKVANQLISAFFLHSFLYPCLPNTL